MECANHPGVEPAVRCVTCGKCPCADCMVDMGRYYRWRSKRWLRKGV